MLVILHSHGYGTKVLELKSAIHGEVSGTQLSFIIAGVSDKFSDDPRCVIYCSPKLSNT